MHCQRVCQVVGVCENCQPSLGHCTNANYQSLPVFECPTNISSFGNPMYNTSFPSIDYNYPTSMSTGNILSMQNIPKATSFCKSF